MQREREKRVEQRIDRRIKTIELIYLTEEQNISSSSSSSSSSSPTAAEMNQVID